MAVKIAVRFRGKISWEGQSNDLPPEVFSFLLFDGYDREVVKSAIEAQAHAHTQDQGMYVQSVQGELIDLARMPQDRMFVPMKWIVNIKPEIINFTHELSTPDHDGVERLEDGSEPIPQ